MAPKPSTGLIRFGAFDVDPRAGELRKQGRKVKLQDLPFQFLAALLERPGQVVTREELVRRLWSESAVIDVDNGLNTAAKKVRVALGDDADTPRFIETLPRRGYRFIGVIENVEISEAPQAADPALPVLPPDLPSPDPPSALPEPPPPRRFRQRWLALPPVILLTLVAIRLLIPPRPAGMLRLVQLTHTGRVEPFSPIVTDGSRIYFDERFGGQWSLAQVSVEGGTPSPIQTPAGNAELRAISPNRAELLVGITTSNEEDAPLWIIPTVAGAARRLGSALAHAAVWSRDGRAVVYAFGNALYRIGRDGAGATKWIDTPGPAYEPRWSPPGMPDLLRFTIVGPAYSIWECASDGSGLRRFPISSPLEQTTRGVQGVGWTPDGNYYLYESRTDHGTGIWSIRQTRDLYHPLGLDRRPRQIYATPSEMGFLVPAVDGKKLFFAIGQERRELIAFDARRSQFLPFLSGAAVRGVTFSKDGRSVAYETIPEGTLWRSRPDGTERMQLTAPPLRVSEPHWSPDGRRIAFTGWQPGSLRNRVYVVPSNGGSVELAPTDPYDAASLSWSPDGQSLMVGCWQGNWPSTAEVCLFNWKTRQIDVLPGTQGLLRPSWSPDGRYLAALGSAGTEVFLYDIAARRATRVADGANYGIAFWTRDSRYFYFQKMLGDAAQPIFRASVATRTAKPMMTSAQIPQSGFSAFVLTGLTAGDEPIASVLRSNGDLYAMDVDLP